MKVDKGVCTTNDAYFAGNAGANELNSIIKFETVFTTLVENKILAIKRECEEHESKKKSTATSRSFKGILARKPDVTKSIENEAANDGEKDKKKKKKHKNFFLRHKNKQLSEVDVERGEKREATNEAKEATPAPLDSQSNELQVNLPAVESDGQKNCDKLPFNSPTEHAQLTLSTNNSSSQNVHSFKTVKEVEQKQDESLATTIDCSLQQQSSVIVVQEKQKSDIAIYDDGVSSQNTSDIEFSLVSESISELPVHSRKKISTNSDPIAKRPTHFLSPPLTREVKVSERKAISCQSTPLFGRHQKAQASDSKKVLTFQKELPKKVEIEKAKSQTIVTAPTSTTTTTTLAKPITTVAGPVENVHANRKSQKHSKYRDVSVEYEISYDDNEGNQSPRGFISSFNQLTSQTPPAAVITTANPKKQSKAPSSKQLDASAGDKADDKTAKHQEIELELDDLAIDKRKRRRRQSSRCSDPVIYPSSSGLKHCILSRPPNQPLQIEYDTGYMYDVSLQIESEFNGEIKSIVPAEHKKHRHKHQHHDHERCKERKKRKRRKILVHNLDDKSLKVIDPDELPQRAKFTIIATACLLLIMCLLLVGITLRMAPIIDDMVRQENERLIQESLNRARLGANFTDPPPISAPTSAPSHHPTSKMLQGNFVP